MIKQLDSSVTDSIHDPAPKVVAVDCALMPRKDALLRMLSGACGFPSYFGHNWDAFEECWGDMLDETVFTVVLFANAHAILLDESDTELDIFFDIIRGGESKYVDQSLLIFTSSADCKDMYDRRIRSRLMKA